jgi:hypothetical protein
MSGESSVPSRPRLVMTMTPRKPTSRPATPLTRMGSSRRKMADRTIAKRGTGDVRIAASEESTVRSAQVMSANGMTMLMTAMTSRCP